MNRFFSEWSSVFQSIWMKPNIMCNTLKCRDAHELERKKKSDDETIAIILCHTLYTRPRCGWVFDFSGRWPLFPLPRHQIHFFSHCHSLNHFFSLYVYNLCEPYKLLLNALIHTLQMRNAAYKLCENLLFRDWTISESNGLEADVLCVCLVCSEVDWWNVGFLSLFRSPNSLFGIRIFIMWLNAQKRMCAH